MKQQYGKKHPVVFLIFLVLAGQDTIIPYYEQIQIELPSKGLCTTCPEGSPHKEIPRITIEELRKKMESGADIVVLDARPKAMYDEGHIKGALSFPWALKITQGDVRQLPRDRMIIIYCDCGPGESDSVDLAAQLIEIGFNVKVLADPSIRGWIKAGYPVEK